MWQSLSTGEHIRTDVPILYSCHVFGLRLPTVNKSKNKFLWVGHSLKPFLHFCINSSTFLRSLLFWQHRSSGSQTVDCNPAVGCDPIFDGQQWEKMRRCNGTRQFFNCLFTHSALLIGKHCYRRSRNVNILPNTVFTYWEVCWEMWKRCYWTLMSSRKYIRYLNKLQAVGRNTTVFPWFANGCFIKAKNCMKPKLTQEHLNWTLLFHIKKTSQ